MPRFSIGDNVEVIGALAEYYTPLKVVVTAIIPHDSGLSHLTKYRVRTSDETEDLFYEFQLRAIRPGESDTGQYRQASA